MKESVGRKNGVSSPCKLLRRRCTTHCIFGPYFPADEPRKFASVHKVFGASNVSKMLQELPERLRRDAASSMVYEAKASMRDPVYGCAGAISYLQQQVDGLRHQLALAKAEVVHLRVRQAVSTQATSPSGSRSPPSYGSSDPKPSSELSTVVDQDTLRECGWLCN